MCLSAHRSVGLYGTVYLCTGATLCKLSYEASLAHHHLIFVSGFMPSVWGGTADCQLDFETPTCAYDLGLQLHVQPELVVLEPMLQHTISVLHILVCTTADETAPPPPVYPCCHAAVLLLCPLLPNLRSRL